MDFTVREATAADAAAIASLNADVQALHAAALPQLFKPVTADALAASAVEDMLDNQFNVVFIAHVGAEPAGYAYAELISRAETAQLRARQILYLHHISVRPAYRRRGVGSALVGSLRAAARELGAASLTLDIWMFNDDARAFFRRHGFSLYFERLYRDV